MGKNYCGKDYRVPATGQEVLQIVRELQQMADFPEVKWYNSMPYIFVNVADVRFRVEIGVLVVRTPGANNLAVYQVQEDLTLARARLDGKRLALADNALVLTLAPSLMMLVRRDEVDIATVRVPVLGCIFGENNEWLSLMGWGHLQQSQSTAFLVDDNNQVEAYNEYWVGIVTVDWTSRLATRYGIRRGAELEPEAPASLVNGWYGDIFTI